LDKTMTAPKKIGGARQLFYSIAAGGGVFLLGERPGIAVIVAIGLGCYFEIQGWFADLNRAVAVRHDQRLDSGSEPISN
jgi:hypothetical protein